MKMKKKIFFYFFEWKKKFVMKKKIRFLLLCEVALGRMYQTAHGKFMEKDDLFESHYHSLKGCGTFGPNPAYDVTL
jgi:hypothetical protein